MKRRYCERRTHSTDEAQISTPAAHARRPARLLTPQQRGLYVRPPKEPGGVLSHQGFSPATPSSVNKRSYTPTRPPTAASYPGCVGKVRDTSGRAPFGTPTATSPPAQPRPDDHVPERVEGGEQHREDAEPAVEADRLLVRQADESPQRRRLGEGHAEERDWDHRHLARLLCRAGERLHPLRLLLGSMVRAVVRRAVGVVALAVIAVALLRRPKDGTAAPRPPHTRTSNRCCRGSGTTVGRRPG
mmetsp:Transcript_51755/g.166911  ORF Transcript_51755/g.166911 Transcript_51755/m.166911 type:complete len:244 (+) Transcript_51755:666-1397(+)